MTEREKIIQQQKQLKALFSVWMKEKMNHEVVTFQKTDGKIVEHYPDGSEKLWVMQNKAIFYCGTNGSGKNTLRSFNQDAVQIVIDSDHIAMQINPQNPRLADIDAGRKAIGLFRLTY